MWWSETWRSLRFRRSKAAAIICEAYFVFGFQFSNYRAIPCIKFEQNGVASRGSRGMRERSDDEKERAQFPSVMAARTAPGLLDQTVAPDPCRSVPDGMRGVRHHA